MEKVITTQRVPVKLWLENIEEGALEQAKNLADLPFAFKHIAIMPDSHQGYGMPIGGVLAAKRAIIPNAVGVDIGCFDKDTEFLLPNGWKKISEYNGEDVMQFDPDSGISSFTQPERFIKKECDYFYHINTKYGIDQMLSPEHRCLVYKYDRSYNFDKYKIVQAETLTNKHSELKNGYRHRFLTSFKPDLDTRVNIDDIKLKVLIMLSADAHNRNKDTGSYVLRLKKERKIKRAKDLLSNANIDYKENHENSGVTNISFHFNSVLNVGNKQKKERKRSGLLLYLSCKQESKQHFPSNG